MSTAEAVAIIDIPVDFQGVSFGENTARLGVKINRDNMSIERANDSFAGHRLTGKIIAGDKTESQRQLF